MPPGVTVAITPATLNDGETATIVLTGEESLAPGSYTVTIEADDGAATETIDLDLEVLGDVNIITPVADAEYLLETVGGCASTGNNAIFVDYEFDEYTGAPVTDYTLYVSLVGGGTFPTATVVPNVVNTRGYCANNDDEFIFRIEANLTGGGTVVSCSGNFFARIILPVNWLTFDARPSGKTALLSWSVTQDLLNEGFTVERSAPAATNWEAVGYTESTGVAGNENYSFTDSNVGPGNTFLYRLRQEDSDGAISYSEIRTVTFSDDTNGVSVRPNPAGDFVLLSTLRNDPETLHFILTNGLGQTISTGKFPSGQVRVNLTDLPPAMYQIVISGKNNYREVKRIIKR